MEDNNRKGPGVFYAVVGVATLVVAIIGATFAYFSASVTPGDDSDDVTGGTLELSASDLSLTVTRVNKTITDKDHVSSLDLVPTDINGADATSVNGAVAAHCEADGYTGCHLYKVVASSNVTVDAADIQVDELTTTSSKNKAEWQYSIFEGTDVTATKIVKSGAFEVASTAPVKFHTTGLDNTGVTYYLLVFVKNEESVQNDGATNDVQGTYNGSISLNVAGGKVAATFAA